MTTTAFLDEVLGTDLFKRWETIFLRDEKFDPFEDDRVPWKIFQHFDPYEIDDREFAETFDHDPFSRTFVKAHSESDDVVLEVTGGVMRNLLDEGKDDEFAFPFYAVEYGILNNNERFRNIFVEAMHWIVAAAESSRVAYFKFTGDSRFYRAEICACAAGNHSEKVVARLSLLEEDADFYAHGLPMEKTFVKNWREYYEEIYAAHPQPSDSLVELDTHAEAAENLSRWLRRNVHRLPPTHLRLFAADMGFLTYIRRVEKKRGFTRETPEDMNAWAKLMKLCGRCAAAPRVPPLEFRLKPNFRAKDERKRKRKTYGPFDFSRIENARLFERAVALLKNVEVKNFAAPHFHVDPSTLENPFRTGLRVFQQRDEMKDFAMRSEDDRVKRETRHLFEYLDRVGLTFGRCFSLAEQLEKYPELEQFRGIETWKDLSDRLPHSREF